MPEDSSRPSHFLGGAANADAATEYKVKADSVAVRNGPSGQKASGYVIGTLYGNNNSRPNRGGAERFDLIRKSADGNWGYGYAHGKFGTWGGGHCGWVLMSATRKTKKTVNPSCPAIGGDDPADDGLASGKLFAPGSFVSGTGGGTVQAAVVVACANSAVYGNYDPATGTFSNKYPTPLPAGRGTKGKRGVTSGYKGFGTRYQTADGRAWLIKDSRSPAGAGRLSVPVWHFIRAECIRRF